MSAATTPRSYIVKTNDGVTYRRNNNMLRQAFRGRRGVTDTFEYDTPEIEHEEHAPGVGRNGSSATVATQLAKSAATTTRYGRQVKPPKRYPDKET